VAPHLGAKELHCLMQTSKRMRSVFGDAFCRQILPPVANRTLWLTRTSEYRSALVHVIAASERILIDLDRLCVTICTDHNLDLVLFILEYLAKKLTRSLSRVSMDFFRRGRGRFRAQHVQSLFRELPLVSAGALLISGLEVDDAPISSYSFAATSPFTHVSIDNCSIRSAPFQQLFAFLETGKLESLSFPSLLPSHEAYIDCSETVRNFTFPHLETVQIKGQFQASSVVQFLKASPLIYQVELFQRKESKLKHLAIKPRGPTIALNKLRVLSGTVTHILSVVRRFHLPYLRQIQIIEDEYQPNSRAVGTFIKRVGMCLEHTRPTYLSLVLPNHSTRNPSLANLDASQIGQLVQLSIGGLQHYPYHISRVSVQY
jgi:hypothetical protein